MAIAPEANGIGEGFIDETPPDVVDLENVTSEAYDALNSQAKKTAELLESYGVQPDTFRRVGLDKELLGWLIGTDYDQEKLIVNGMILSTDGDIYTTRKMRNVSQVDLAITPSGRKDILLKNPINQMTPLEKPLQVINVDETNIFDLHIKRQELYWNCSKGLVEYLRQNDLPVSDRIATIAGRLTSHYIKAA